MSHVVVKPFKSVNRKFNVGEAITAADIDTGSAFSIDDWIARGFVKAGDAPAAPSTSRFKSFVKADAE